MQVLVLGNDNVFKIAERPMPEPEPGEVLFRTHYAGICGSDLHAPMLDSYLREVVLGHEFAGEVAAAGPGVEGWQAGDRAAVHPKGDVCRNCFHCRKGWFNMCSDADISASAGIRRDGGMAEYVSLPADKLRRLPDAVSTLEGAWVEPAGVALRGVIRSGFQLGKRAAVIGAGPIGLLTLTHLRNAGASEIIVLEPSESRRAKAAELGADIAIDPLSEDLSAVFGDPAAMPEFVFECSGASAAADMAVNIAQPRGCLTLIGVPTSAVSLNSFTIISKELTIRSSTSAGEQFDDIIGMFARRELDIRPLTSDIAPLADFGDAFSRLQNGTAIKILLQPGE